MTQRQTPHDAHASASTTGPAPDIAPTPFTAPVEVGDDGQATLRRTALSKACDEQVATEGRLCMSRDAEPWDSRHVVPEDDNAYGVRRVHDAAGQDTRHDTRHEGGPQG